MFWREIRKNQWIRTAGQNDAFSYFCKKTFMDFYGILVHAHSGLRWVILILILMAILNAAKSRSSGKYLKKDKMLNLFAMVSLHLQFVLGLITYFLSPKVQFYDGWMGDRLTRFFALEHVLLMLVAIVVITIGRSRAEKKLEGSRNKHRAILISYTIGLLIILASIPWPIGPWASLGSQWA